MLDSVALYTPLPFASCVPEKKNNMLAIIEWNFTLFFIQSICEEVEIEREKERVELVGDGRCFCLLACRLRLLHESPFLPMASWNPTIVRSLSPLTTSSSFLSVHRVAIAILPFFSSSLSAESVRPHVHHLHAFMEIGRCAKNASFLFLNNNNLHNATDVAPDVFAFSKFWELYSNRQDKRHQVIYHDPDKIDPLNEALFRYLKLLLLWLAQRWGYQLLDVCCLLSLALNHIYGGGDFLTPIY